jgi:hypothetical protein
MANLPLLLEKIDYLQLPHLRLLRSAMQLANRRNFINVKAIKEFVLLLQNVYLVYVTRFQ